MSHGSPRSWEGKMPRATVSICLLVFTLAGYSIAMQWDREGAESALQQAREIRSSLGDAQSSNRGDYLRCVRLYKRVWLSDPHYSGCDDAIYEAALLYQEMSGKFKAPEYIQESADLLRFLLKDYSVSPFRRDARARLAALEGQSPESAPVQAAMEVRTTDASARTVPQASPAAPQGVSPPTDHAADATAGAAGHGGPATVQSIRHWSAGDRTRVMIDVDGPVRFQSGKVENPDRLFFDLSNAELGRGLAGKTITVGDTFLKQIRAARNKPGVARVVLDLEQKSEISISQLENPFRILIDIRTPGAPEPAPLSASVKPAPAPVPPAGQAARPEKIETAAARTDSAASEKSQPQTAAGPRPGEKAIIDTTPLFPAPVKPADAAAQVPAQGARANGKEPATSRAESGIPEKPQLPATVPSKTVETVTAARPAPATTSTQPADGNAGDGSSSDVREAANRAKPFSPPAAAMPPPRVNPPPTEPAVKSTPRSEVVQVLPRAPADTTLKKTATDRVAADQGSASTPTRNRDTSPPAKRASPTSRGDMTMTRVLGLKVGRIVIDPGHGGHDTGTVGRNGLMEKDLVLDVALNLKKSLEERLGAQVLMTRSDDRFISLEERTAIANRHKADLFVSIHANASTSRSTSGVETYYLNFARTAADREIAARENATTLMSIGELQNLVRKIAMADKATESRELAALMQRSLFSGSRVIFPKSRNRGVRSAPFVVLIGAEMPAVLVEVAFISNPRDEKALKKENSQQVLAQALLTGIEGYLKSLASYNMADSHPGSN